MRASAARWLGSACFVVLAGWGCKSNPPDVDEDRPAALTSAPVASTAAPATASVADPSVGVGANDEEEALAIFEKLVAVLDANQGDCGKMAAAVKKFMSDNGDTMRRLKAKSSSQTPEQKRAFQQQYKPRAEAMVKKMIPAMAKCNNDPRLTEALQSMPL